MKAQSLSAHNPFVYFWLGILTGALIILASLMVQQYAFEGSASVLNNPATSRSINVPTSMGAARSINVPTSLGAAVSAGAAKSINVPTSKVGSIR